LRDRIGRVYDKSANMKKTKIYLPKKQWKKYKNGTIVSWTSTDINGQTITITTV